MSDHHLAEPRKIQMISLRLEAEILDCGEIEECNFHSTYLKNLEHVLTIFMQRIRCVHSVYWTVEILSISTRTAKAGNKCEAFALHV